MDANQLEPLRSVPQTGMMSEEEIQQMIVLATRLREQAGGELDDDALLAVSEATGAPVDYIRLAMRSIPEQMRRQSLIEQVRNSFLAFNPDARRLVGAAVLATGAGFFQFLVSAAGDTSGLFKVCAAICWLLGIYNAAVSRAMRTALFAGLILGGGSQFAASLFAFIDGLIKPPVQGGSDMPYFIAASIFGSIAGLAASNLFQRYRKDLGFGDPVEERHALLSQLLEIQQKLKQDEKYVTFISVDVVGSTKIKTENDELSVEFTFNEYHRFIEAIVTKNGGKIHSTAGDGVTCVFDQASAAVSAGKAMQAGLFEFNAFRNKLQNPIAMRAAIHTGSVLAPGQESTAVNFAHVIDVAAHLQKVAEPGTLAVSSATAIHVGGLDAIGEERIRAENVEAAIWRPRINLGVADLSTIVPPIPKR